jgi:hypothetical protein
MKQFFMVLVTRLVLWYLKQDPTREQQNLAHMFGLIALDYSDGDYDKAARLLESFRVQHVIETKYTIHVFTERPGIMIGAKGQTIDFFQAKLRTEGYNKKFLIHEVKYPPVRAILDPSLYDFTILDDYFI